MQTNAHFKAIIINILYINIKLFFIPISNFLYLPYQLLLLHHLPHRHHHLLASCPLLPVNIDSNMVIKCYLWLSNVSVLQSSKWLTGSTIGSFTWLSLLTLSESKVICENDSSVPTVAWSPLGSTWWWVSTHPPSSPGSTIASFTWQSILTLSEFKVIFDNDSCIPVVAWWPLGSTWWWVSNHPPSSSGSTIA